MIEDFEQICGQAPEGTDGLNFQASDPNFSMTVMEIL